MEFTIKLNSPELQNLIESGTLLKVLKENTFGGVDAETEQPLGQVAFDLTNPDKPALEVPVTDQEVTVEGFKPTGAPTANKTYTKNELAQAAAQRCARTLWLGSIRAAVSTPPPWPRPSRLRWDSSRWDSRMVRLARCSLCGRSLASWPRSAGVVARLARGVPSGCTLMLPRLPVSSP